jgi:hypothetical protein
VVRPAQALEAQLLVKYTVLRGLVKSRLAYSGSAKRLKALFPLRGVQHAVALQAATAFFLIVVTFAPAFRASK